MLIYALDPPVRGWIEHELFAEAVVPELVDSVAELVTILTLVPAPSPQLLIVDVAAVSRGDIEPLGAIRRAGWPGIAIAIGEPSKALHAALAIDRVLPRTFQRETLRAAIRQRR